MPVGECVMGRIRIDSKGNYVRGKRLLIMTNKFRENSPLTLSHTCMTNISGVVLTHQVAMKHF